MDSKLIRAALCMAIICLVLPLLFQEQPLTFSAQPLARQTLAAPEALPISGYLSLSWRSATAGLPRLCTLLLRGAYDTLLSAAELLQNATHKS